MTKNYAFDFEFSFNDMPDGLKGDVFRLRDVLSIISSHIKEFSAALELFDFSHNANIRRYQQEKEEYDALPKDLRFRSDALRKHIERCKAHIPECNWTHIAARDGAITLFNFLRAIQTVKIMHDKNKFLREAININISNVDKAIKLLYDNIKHIEGVRDAVAHFSEIVRSKKNNLKTAIKDNNVNVPAGGIWMGNLSDRTYSTTTYNGIHVTYDITQETLDIMTQAAELTFSAFPRRSYPFSHNAEVEVAVQQDAAHARKPEL